MPQRTKLEEAMLRRKDINLPDEKKGKVVGDIDIYDAKGPDGKKFRVSKQIFGGDPNDPRWEEHRARIAASKGTK